MEAHENDKLALTVIMNEICESDSDLDSTSSSSSDSSEENDSTELSAIELQTIYSILMIAETRGIQICSEKILDYVERVIPGYSRTICKEHFRMFPATFEAILTMVGPSLNVTLNGRQPIDPKKQLLIALWFISTPDSYRSVCVKFGVRKATAFRALRRVTYALHCVAPKLIRWPRENVGEVVTQFERQSGFPNNIGAIDGTHIKIRKPLNDPDSYINRKGFYSVILQAICDAKCLFTHCFAGFPGSVHDSRVFRNSSVAKFLNCPEEYFPNNSHIIGDAAYSLHPNVMVPFRDNRHLSHRQKNFNYCLSSTRMCIERAFGLLKIRFRILLDCLPLRDIQKIPEFIIACCVLHNICILNNDMMDIYICSQQQIQLLENNSNVDIGLGNEKRLNIMNELRIRI